MIFFLFISFLSSHSLLFLPTFEFSFVLFLISSHRLVHWLGNAALQFLSDYTEMLFLQFGGASVPHPSGPGARWHRTFSLCPFCACCVGGGRPIFNPGQLRSEGKTGVNCSRLLNLMDVCGVLSPSERRDAADSGGT